MGVVQPTLEVVGVGKRLNRDLALARRQGMGDIVRELRWASEREGLRTGEFWALDDVTFSVDPGEAIGIIGHNGAGKTTLLRMLNGLTRPSRGSITVRGTHTALIDLNAPFKSLLSGRENIDTALSVHGVPKSDAERLTADIAEFSELEDVLDAPMWTYSTGMQMRLGFSIAAQLRPDLLIVDEIIAVGDIAFQRKCLRHIRQHLGAGGSVVLASHDLWMIQALCHRCLVLSAGRVVEDGTPNHAISTYIRSSRSEAVFVPTTREGFAGERGADDGRVTVEVLAWSADGGEPRNRMPANLDLAIRATTPVEPVTWSVDVLTANRQVCLARLAAPEGTAIYVGDRGVRVRCTIPRLPLLPGTYFLDAHVYDVATGEEVASTTSPVPVDVASGNSRLETLAQLPGALALTSLDTTYSLPTTSPNASTDT